MTNDDRYQISLTHEDINLIITALFDHALDCEHRTANSVPDTPRPQDLCCDYHRQRYTMLKEQNEVLRKEARQTNDLAEVLEALIA